MTTTSSPRPPKGPRWLRTALHSRAGTYSGMTGAPKNVARAVSLTPRRIRQIRAGDPGGVPQNMIDWLDALCDGGRTNPYPLAVMLLERMHERMAEGNPDLPARWVAVCTEETRRQGAVDLCQLTLREGMTQEALERFVGEAAKEAQALLEMMGIARVMIGRLA